MLEWSSSLRSAAALAALKPMLHERIEHIFTLIFPQWDMITVILGVFLMGWIVNEGKSNYFKGSILIFTYLVVVVGFWWRFGTLSSWWKHIFRRFQGG